MRSRLLKLILSTIILSMLITSVSGQDYYYDEPTYRFSEYLREGVELTWIFLQYSIILPEITDSGPTTYTYYEEYTSTDENGSEVTTTYEYEQVEEEFYDFPDITENTLYTVTLLQDLANITDLYYDFDYNEENLEYFDISVSTGNITEIIEFLPPYILFRPSTIEYDNGTKLNVIEYEYEQQMQYLETQTDVYGDEGLDFDLSMKDGVYTEFVRFNEDNETNILETRIDVDTGVTVYLYALYEGLDSRYEIEISLYETVGIDLANPGPNEELTLPLSPFFVYALLVIPIIVSKFRKQK